MRISLLLFMLPVAFAPDPEGDGTYRTSEALVLQEGDVLNAGQSQSFHASRCKVRLQRDGNMVVHRLVAPNPYYQYYEKAWSSGTVGPVDGLYHAELNDHDGSLEVYRDQDELVFTTNVGDPEFLNSYSNLQRDHELRINEECILTIHRDDMEVWTNNHYGGLSGEAGYSNFLQKGEMMNLNVCLSCEDAAECIYVRHTLYLQHDCNLVQFRGQDLADRPEHPTIFWTSNSVSNVDDCYLYEDEDTLRLYSGTLDKSLAQFDARAGEVLWEADDDFQNPCSGGYEVLLKPEGGLQSSC